MNKVSAKTLYLHLIGRRIWQPLCYVSEEGNVTRFNDLPEGSTKLAAATTTRVIAKVMEKRS